MTLVHRKRAKLKQKKTHPHTRNNNATMPWRTKKNTRKIIECAEKV